MRHEIDRALRRLEWAVDWLGVVLFLAMFILVLASVVLRTLGEPLIWGDELTRYLFVWVALLGWAIAARRGSHIAILNIVSRLPRTLRFGFEMLSHIAVLGFLVVLVVQGARMAVRNLDIETTTLFFTFAVVYAAAPVAGVLVGIEMVRRMLITIVDYADPEGGR